MWISLAVTGKWDRTGLRRVLTWVEKSALVFGAGMEREEGAKWWRQVGERRALWATSSRSAKAAMKDSAICLSWGSVVAIVEWVGQMLPAPGWVANVSIQGLDGGF